VKLLAYAISQTGICDELLALVRTEVVSIDNRGIPKLTKDWWSKVDLLLLDEMHEHFGVQADSTGKFGIAQMVRKKLDRKWVKGHYGWSFENDPHDIIYEYEEFDEWRRAYEEKQQSRSDGVAGVHRFS